MRRGYFLPILLPFRLGHLVLLLIWYPHFLDKSYVPDYAYRCPERLRKQLISIQTRMWFINWCHFQWPWTNPNPVFKVRPFFDAKYITNAYGYAILRLHLVPAYSRPMWCSTRFCYSSLLIMFTTDNKRLASIRCDLDKCSDSLILPMWIAYTWSAVVYNVQTSFIASL